MPADWVQVQQRLAASRASTRVRAAAELREFGLPAIHSLARLLSDRVDTVRAAAAESLGWIDAPASLERLTMAIDDPSRQVRQTALTALCRLTVPGVHEVLCVALKDRELKAEVALKLVRRGDPRALPTLIAALREPYVGGSAVLQRALGWAVLALGLLLLLGMVAGPLTKWALVIFIVAGNQPFAYFRSRKQQSEATGTLAQAIVKLLELHPQPDAHDLVGDLNVIAGDPLHHSRSVRSIARAAAIRIDQLTAAERQLPIPVEALALTKDQLPRPAELHATVEQTVPLQLNA